MGYFEWHPVASLAVLVASGEWQRQPHSGQPAPWPSRLLTLDGAGGSSDRSWRPARQDSSAQDFPIPPGPLPPLGGRLLASDHGARVWIREGKELFSQPSASLFLHLPGTPRRGRRGGVGSPLCKGPHSSLAD